MESLEDAARDAADRWNSARKDVKNEIRMYALELLKTKKMTEVARIIGVRRTSLYYFLYGRDGKTKSTLLAHDADLSVHDRSRELRKSA